MRRFLLIGLAVASAARPALPRASDVTQVQINAAIDRGVAHLLELYADGEGRDPRIPPGSPLTLLDRPGMRALTVYALLKSGVQPRHPVVERLVANLAFERFTQTYDTSCMLLALESLDPVGQRAWIEELAAFLIRNRNADGELGYPSGGDLSNTQFAALGLRAAASAGVAMPAEVWTGLAKAVLQHQTADGGFSYIIRDDSPTDTMTAAGVGTLAICELELVRCAASEPALAQRLRRARAEGLAWLAKRLDVTRDVDRGSWVHYFLYGLERAGGLCNVDRIGEHDWYQEGAAYLVEAQDDQGAWHGPWERAPTLLALLFLSRATSGAATGSRTAPVTGRLSRPHPHTPGTGVVGGARLEVEGERNLRMWLTRLVSPANAAYEWPGERGFGPHVALVEYLADGVPIHVVLGDATRPARDARFTGVHRGLPTGTHRIAARIHVAAPEARAAGGERRARGSAASGPAQPDHVIMTNSVEVEVVEGVPVSPTERAYDPDVDLMRNAGPKATSSSVISKATGWEIHSFAPRQAADSNPRSPWIAKADDASPWLKLQLSVPQRANVIRIAPARLAPRNPDFLTLPLEVSVAIDKASAVTRPVHADETWIEIELDEPALVRSVEIRLIGRELERASVGVGEVVLELRTR